MTIESTFPSSADYVPSRWERTPLSDQRRALAALDRIVELHPNLPAAFITLSYVHPELVDVQAQSWPALEAWREALNVPSFEVRPGNCEPEWEHLEFKTVVDGAPVRVYVIGELVGSSSDSSAVAA